MESHLKFLPHKSYNKLSLLLLILFLSFGVVVIGVAIGFESKATLQCNPDKTLANDLLTRKYIETQCLLRYTQEFYPSLPLYVLIAMNFGIVLLISVFYAYSVNDQVETFEDLDSTTTDGKLNEILPLSDNSTGNLASGPLAHENSGGCINFTRYITHLFIGRIIPLTVFASLLLTSSNFPVQFQCPIPHANVSQGKITSVSTVDCIYPMGSKIEKVAATIVTVNLLFGIVAFMELAYLLCSSWKDRNLCNDMDFCSFRKPRRIRKII